MRSSRRRTVPVPALLAVTFALGFAACGSPGPAASAVTPAPSAATAVAPTAVPAGSGEAPGSAATRVPTTQTDWGEITDALPGGFPVFPDAAVAEPPSEPVSGAFLSPASVDEVAAWYRDALEAAGNAVDLSSPLEDGSRVLDAQGNAAGCRIRVTLRPEGESTMITVLFAAGCVGSGG